MSWALKLSRAISLGREFLSQALSPCKHAAAMPGPSTLQRGWRSLWALVLGQLLRNGREAFSHHFLHAGRGGPGPGKPAACVSAGGFLQVPDCKPAATMLPGLRLLLLGAVAAQLGALRGPRKRGVWTHREGPLGLCHPPGPFPQMPGENDTLWSYSGREAIHQLKSIPQLEEVCILIVHSFELPKKLAPWMAPGLRAEPGVVI